MLDNLAVVIKAENVDARVIFAIRPDLVAVQDNQITLSDGADEMRPLVGMFPD